MPATARDLPDLLEGVVWSEDGSIFAAAVIAATDGGVFPVYSCAGDVDRVDAVLSSLSLQHVPDRTL
ncbi:hypothetical protein C2U72_07790 [Prosthecomicrobium hirschii]|uniref:hypothetical protein n=1 Tax=Prosthecodimorpha hirschii TaxID=665126 RepID=UPI00112BB9E4|nr:hypothetical protein [Prosthecomicrobium hirschii]TPQ51528.1 hypothetical protein C2U72_07790 [Prosthecomicrobium hirschii]